ncbi:cobalamin biosynthesis protein CobD [Paracoccus liaowanqingii]|uniref:Cobalamin biosynthesis protein CobD n=1 Tax=Paracoccus liaowanqingii TaxID=2560053 RepID=A0A4P7HK69_9RHOB|nr:adenosylcobinamide-phosphate synthase CbiB [Paracoccus liaowanqingii]QBX34506.1 cobalamin biosynthesis protein CobD [Paracoccus liaowanqingii]
MAMIALLALVLDALIGWPDAVYRRIGHPVTWLGRLISALDRWLNHGMLRQAKGALTVALVVAAAAIPAALVQVWLGPWIAAMLAWPLVAARSLDQHLQAVARPLAAGDLPAARAATAMIVGRDVTRADAPALTRASLESLAENASDGVIAPLFWAAVGGLPGIAAYKAINTMDSMIGHRTPRHEDFGKVAARLDDLVNLIPARLTAVLIAAASGRRAGAALRVAWHDAPAHRSPNAGWPEGAMAGALDCRLSGPRVYADRVADEPWLNADAPDPQAADLARGIALIRRAVALAGVALLALALI